MIGAALVAGYLLLDLAIKTSPRISKGMATQKVPALATLLRFKIAMTRAAMMSKSPSTRIVVGDIYCCLSSNDSRTGLHLTEAASYPLPESF